MEEHRHESLPTRSLQLRSRALVSEEIELSLVEVEIASPTATKVLVRLEVTPINPSDLGLILGPAVVSTARFSGSGASAVVTRALAAAAMRHLSGRIGKSMSVGKEGAGVVIAAANRATGPFAEFDALGIATIVDVSRLTDTNIISAVRCKAPTRT
jgi:hypothetical protein